jgi:hypothetical protein
MTKTVFVRLFYAPACSGGCCGGGCGPDPIFEEFEKLAEKLVEKYGEEGFTFEAYNSTDVKKFPFLSVGKKGEAVKTPAVTVGEQIVSNGKIPSFAEMEKVIAKALK